MIVKCGVKQRHLQVPKGFRKLNSDEVVTKEIAPLCRVANIIELYGRTVPTMKLVSGQA